jgi:F0F1-type ATP synthase membrane subunit b/b'
MSIDPSVSIVISFLGFCWIFAKKVYPMLTQKLDEHIEAVKQQIAEAEKLREDAAAALKKAQEKEGEIEKIIIANRLKSEEKIRRLHDENERLLKILRERHEISLKTQLEAEVVKQKNQLIDRLADLILKRISEKIEETDYKFSISLKKEDLNKLLESNSKTIH